MNNLLHRFMRWYETKLGIGVYGLKENEIIIYRGIIRNPGTIRVDEIESYCIYPEMGVDIVIINLKNGYSWQLLDKYNDLIGILNSVAKELKREPI